MAVRERVSLPLPATPPSLPAAEVPVDLMADNRRLQELLHQALRREAEALRKLKHLSLQLAEFRATCRTPTLAEANGLPACRVESPEGVSSGLSQSSDNAPVGAGATSSSGPNSPTIIIDKRTSLSTPDFMAIACSTSPVTTDTVRQSTSEHSLCQNSISHGQGEQMHQRSQLAPVPRDLKDVRREREKPPSPEPRPPSPHTERQKLLIHHSSSPEDLSTVPAPVPAPAPSKKFYTLSKKPSLKVRKTKSHGLAGELKDPPRQRSSTASSRLRPTWLIRRRATNSASKSQRPQVPGSFDDLFSQFQRSTSTIYTDPLAKRIGQHWLDVCSVGERTVEDNKYFDAVWELFQSECKYLTQQLRPLEQIYKGFLEELHFYDLLVVADTDKIFANLSELCELSASVARDLFKLFHHRSGSMVAPSSELILAFSMFGHKFNPVYQRFCVNFEKQRGFIKALEQLPDFQEYLRVCRGHRMVHRNDLTSLLIAPIQHQFHYQLLLEKVLKNTRDPTDRSVLSSAIKAFTVALKELEGNIADHKRSLELLELQEMLSWPSVTALDPDAYIPESLLAELSSQGCQEVLASEDRQLLFKGDLKLMDGRGKPSTDLSAFLFTQLLLLAEPRSKPNKKELTQYCVFRHPLFLANLEVHEVTATPSQKHLITLVERSALGQRVAVFTVLAPSQQGKEKWVNELLRAKEALWHRQTSQ